MPEIQKPTIQLYVPKFGKVCDINADEEQFFREQYGATTLTEKQAADAAAEKAAADAATKNAGDAEGNAKSGKRPNPFNEKKAADAAAEKADAPTS